MRSEVIITRSRWNSWYIATVIGKYGGGYRGARAGHTPQDAAAYAAREMQRYARHNSEGGDLSAPPEVLELVPERWRSIAAQQEEKKRAPRRGGAARGRRPVLGGRRNGTSAVTARAQRHIG